MTQIGAAPLTAADLNNVAVGTLGYFLKNINLPNPTDWRAGLSEITITTNSTQAIQNAIDAAGPSGRKIVFPASLGTYNPTSRLVFTGKQNIVLTGLNNPLWETNQGAFEIVTFLGGNNQIDVTGIKMSNTLNSSGAAQSLITGYEQGPNLNIRLANLELTCPNVNTNAITFTPYSPLNESGNGTGNLLQNLTVEHCLGQNIGRMFLEINSHVRADNRNDCFVEGLLFQDNMLQNLGTKDDRHGMGFSGGGIQRKGRILNNTIIDAKYSNIEVVSSVDYYCENNKFYITSGKSNNAAGYAISQDAGAPTIGLIIKGGGGTVRGRPLLIFDAIGFRVIGGDYTSESSSDIRSSFGVLDNVNLKLANADGGVISLQNCDRVDLIGGTYEIVASNGKQPYSVVDLGPANRNTRCTIFGVTMKRPTNALDTFIHQESGDGNTISQITYLTTAAAAIGPYNDYSQKGVIIDDGGGSFGGTASTSSARVFDGDIATIYDAANNAAGKYVGRDMGEPTILNRVVLTPRQDATFGQRLNTSQVQYSTDNLTWTTLQTISGVDATNYATPVTINFAAVTARYWRVFWPNGSSYGNIAEVQLLFMK